MTARKSAKTPASRKKTTKSAASTGSPARKKTSGRKAAAKPVARKSTAKPAAGRTPKTTKKKAPERGRKAAPPKTAAAAAPPESPSPAPSEPASKPAGKVTAADVNLGHVFALRPRVSTTFKQADFLTARHLLQDESWSSIPEAARAVAEKALSLTTDAKGKRGFRPGGR